MSFKTHRTKSTTTRVRKVSRTPQIERLDIRATLDGTASAAAALPWLNLSGLTYSFAPDGTQLGKSTSNLFAELETTGSKEKWQDAFKQAFEEWLVPLGAHASEVKDDGLPFGTFGPTQGDSRMGDVRIGAVPLSNNVMAEAVPHSVITQGTWAGDILLNSNANWTDLQQVLSVALHEFGHVLGLGHSADLQSPMYFHGVSAATAPTAGDIAALKKLYAGVRLDGSELGEASNERDSIWVEKPSYKFDPTLAIPLTPTLGTSVQYETKGELTTKSPNLLYRLEPAGEVDHAGYLNIVLHSQDQNGLIADVTVYDMAGDPMNVRVLSNSGGNKVVQVRDTEPNNSYFVVVGPASGPKKFQTGSFDLFASYGSVALVPTQIGLMTVDSAHPVVEQPFTVTTSRLVHLMIGSQFTLRADPKRAGAIAVWGSLVNSKDEVLAQIAMSPGDTRSAPLVMLEPGDYRLILQTGASDGKALASVKVRIYLDEISIDIGIGAVDPTAQPVLTCSTPGATPTTCVSPPPVVITGGPIYPDPTTLPPAPVYPSIPPWSNPSWFYWPVIANNATSAPLFRQNSLNPMDVSNDQVVTPLDALLIIGMLVNKQSSTTLAADRFYDTNGDGLLTPVDALLVIAELGRAKSTASGEAPISDNTLWATYVEEKPKRFS